LRKANDALNKDAARTAERAAKNATPEPSQATASPIIPESFPTHWELAQFTATLRSKARQGHLTPEEKEWLQAMKPELEKLESSPETFAEFQTALIQSTVGIADGQKVDQIRNTIQRVYEAANDRGLNLQARPQDDEAWVEQRHQLDRRGTGAIQKMLSEEERAAFDRAFLGVMGVDLGTGVDRSLYPPGFLRDEQVNR
jgi:hypothetical protein